MIGGTGENVSASTASLKVIGHPWLEIHLDKGDCGRLRLTAHHGRSIIDREADN